jgi:integrase
MTFEEVRTLLRTHFSELLAKRKAQIAEKGRLSPLDVSALANSLEFARQAVQDGGSLVPGENDGEAASRFIEKYGLDIQPDTPAYANLGTELKRAYRDYCAAVLDYDRSFESYQFDNKTDTAQSQQGVSQAAPYLSLRQLADRFTEESKRGGQWVAKTEHEKTDHIALLIEVLNASTDVSTVSMTDAHRVKDTLLSYPKNRRKDPRTRDLSLSDALNVEGVQTINVQTINKYLRTYGSMFGWAKRNGYVEKNVFDGLNVRVGKKQAQTARTAFTDTQVQTILRELLQNTSGLVSLDYQKWGPLIGLYSGARLNEIAQVHLADIRQDDGVWCFDLNDDDDTKKLKTDASRRLVPIHPRLIELGLLDYVQTLRAGGAQKLFPDFQYCAKNGWGRSLGRWFNDRFLVRLGLKAKGVSFHVFRHTVVTRLLQAGIEQPLVQTIVGHERQGVTQQHYFASGYTLVQRREALEKLRFDCAAPSLSGNGLDGAGKGTERVSLTGAA